MNKKTVQFPDHAGFVAACEQLADDCVDFRTFQFSLQVELQDMPEDYDLARLGECEEVD